MPKTKKFIKLRRAVTKHYIGKKVPSKFRSKYGLRYGKKDVSNLSYAIAKSKGIKTHILRRK